MDDRVKLHVDWASMRSLLPADLDERFISLTVQYPDRTELKYGSLPRDLTFSFWLRVQDDPHGEDITAPLQRHLAHKSISLSYWLVASDKARGVGGACSILKYVKHKIEFSAVGAGILHVTLRT